MPIMPNEVVITQIVPRQVDDNGRGVPGMWVYFRVRDQPEQVVHMKQSDFSAAAAKALVTAKAEQILQTLDMFK